MLNLFNSLTRKVEAFAPLQDDFVRLYTCGPTVYGPAHLGNLRTYLFEDILKRALLAEGYAVKHVMNITDVGHLTSDADEGEDKIEARARRERKTAREIADKYTTLFQADLGALNILLPDILCKATDYITEQIALIQRLEDLGFTYTTSDGVYFDIGKFPQYGKLAHLEKQSLKAGVRVETNPEKRNPRDFALWKFSPKGAKRQMEWPSPWGVGFPGWHLECSAMSMATLGETLDIHCGGIDHVPIHHTNEIAQSEAATGKPFSRFWLHGEFLVLPDARMGKSKGNVITLDDVRKRGLSPLAFRYFCLGAHYRSKLAFSWEALEGAQRGLDNLFDRVRSMTDEPRIGCAEFEAKFQEAIADDLNSPRALAVLWDLLKSDYPDHAKKQSLFVFDEVLGLGLRDLKPAEPTVVPPEVEQLVAERETARRRGDFRLADALRDRVREAGFTIDDTASGPTLRRS